MFEILLGFDGLFPRHNEVQILTHIWVNFNDMANAAAARNVLEGHSFEFRGQCYILRISPPKLI